jgi:Arc/MetJ-type ribon-helix-helix transcriptional regulator
MKHYKKLKEMVDSGDYQNISDAIRSAIRRFVNDGN